MARPDWRAVALLLGVLAIAPLVHRQAYGGYWEDDDLDTLTWARLLPLPNLLLGIPSLKYPPEQGRAPGYFYYAALYRRFGLTYPPYVFVLQIVQSLNVLLLWFLLRRMGIGPPACAAACFFYALSAALFDAWWKPMFIYDVLCTTFALAAILAYAYRRWVLSFAAFWVAMKSKEFGIVVPAVLLGYEMLVGKRNWKRPIPYFLPALIFGALGFLYNLQQHSTYSFHFGLPSLWKTTSFYSSALFGIPYAGFAILILPFLLRDRRAWFGLVVLTLGLAVYLLLPDRLFGVYLCFALSGAAMMVAVAIAEQPRIAGALLLLLIVWQLVLIHRNSVSTLAAGADRRAFVDAVRHVPDAPIYLYDAMPESMHAWGVAGALHLFHEGIQSVDPLGKPGLAPQPGILLLNWDAAARRLDAAPFHPEEAVYVREDRPAPAWQFRAGWQAPEGGYRKIGKQATVRLYRPKNTNDFEWEACAAAPAEVRTFIEGEELPKLHFAEEKCVHAKGTLKPADAAMVTLDFLVSDPPGSARIGDFGFVTP
jgi:hypothetical protein